jgi:DNA-binding protein H-NS
MQLKSMSLDKLTKLKDQVDAVLASKVAEARRTLQSELVKLTRFGGGSTKGARGMLRGSKIAPKYRNPNNPSETWAGRGLKPKWLAAAMKGGKKLEHFAIPGATVAAKASAPKKRGRPRKK